MKPRSLRSRLIMGAAIWSAGLLALASALALGAMHFFPGHGLLVHNSLLAVMGAVIAAAGISVIWRGMSPFDLLKDRLADVRSGRTSRLEGDYPTEIEPLVADLNALLDDRGRRVARAVARAGDLAHGMKTPIAVLLKDIERAEAAGQRELAASMRQQIERMRRQVASYLAQARAVAGGAAASSRASVVDAAHALVRTMERLYAERGLTIEVEVAVDGTLAVRAPIEDLEEMLGNLLENACKWARTRIVLSASRAAERIAIVVDDDGAGLAAELREQVLRRGVRADETAPGSGLGLSIVRELADAYGGTVALDQSPLGGLRATLTLPAAG